MIDAILVGIAIGASTGAAFGICILLVEVWHD